jgi:small subunit ribosomal protein S16
LVAVKLRLKLAGRKGRAFFRLGAFDSQSQRDGKAVEELGIYDPFAKTPEKQYVLKKERIEYWLKIGAQTTESVAVIVRKLASGTLYKPPKPPKPKKAKAKPVEEAAKPVEGAKAPEAKTEAPKAPAAEAPKAAAPAAPSAEKPAAGRGLAEGGPAEAAKAPEPPKAPEAPKTPEPPKAQEAPKPQPEAEKKA